jgi:hypothetical protein
MKELRSTVNAVFLFAVFLLAYAAVSPGHARGSAHPPRFLRMQVEDVRDHGDKRVSISVPYFFVGNVLRVAALGRMHRELDVHFDEDIDSEDLKKIWEELKAANDGQTVKHEHGDDVATFKKEGDMIVLECQGRREDDHVTVRFPSRLIEAAVRDGKDFDVDSVLSELRDAKVGDLVDVKAPDAHIKVWIE